MAALKSLNELLADALRRQSFDLGRYTAKMLAAMARQLTKLEAQLLGEVRRFNPFGARFERTREQRHRAMLKAVRVLIREVYAALLSAQLRTATRVAEIAAASFHAQLRDSVNDEFAALVAASRAIGSMTEEERQRAVRDAERRATTVLVEGAPVKQWFERHAGDLVFRFEASMRQAYANGETIDQAADRVRAILETSNRNARTLGHSAVQALANESRREVYRANGDIIMGVQHVSTFDSRTTEICMARSGLVWDLDGNPVGHSVPYNGGPPLHLNCRSVEVPVLKPLGDMPKKARDAVPRRMRASVDGEIPIDTTFDEWLRGKSEAYQKDALGEGKWQLWKDGKIGLRDLVDPAGNPLSLEELRRRHG